MKSILTLIGLVFMLSTSPAQTYHLLIGTYTKSGKSEGIYVYEFNANTGKATYKNKATGLTNPSYLAISANEKKVYAVCEAEQGKGMVAAFDFDKNSGALSLLNTHPSIGNGPCYVSVDNQNNFVYLSNYGGGSATAIALNPDGSLSDEHQFIQYEGSSVNKERQSAPHVHSTVIAPDGNYLLISDLGTDKINLLEISQERSHPLKEAQPAFIQTEPGSGPRHFDFHPNGKFGYSIQELNGNIGVYAYSNGKLTLLQNSSGLPANYKGRIWAADIHVSPDGKFLYASNRDDLNDLVIFQINSRSGKLKYIGRQSTLGKAPRNFVISPDGNFLLVANQSSDSIIVFKRDKKTGLLTDTSERIAVGSPVCLKFTGKE